MSFNLENKVALVTGANRGIGEAFVRHLLNAGAKKVYSAVRNTESLNSLQAEFPGKIEPVLLDVTNSEHISSLPESINELDVLINNAGIVHECFFTSDEAVEIARKEMETNYFGPLQIIQTVLPILKKSSDAAIINVSSIAGIGTMASIGPYSASKAAIHSLTQGLRAELGSNNIRVVGVYPGPTDTRMTASWEMEKAAPATIAEKTFEAMAAEQHEVFPDNFSQNMYGLFLEHPDKLQEAFS